LDAARTKALPTYVGCALRRTSYAGGRVGVELHDFYHINRFEMKYWEIIADNLQKRGWSYGIAGHLTDNGFLHCIDAHRNDDGRRFVVRSDEILSAFVELERMTSALPTLYENCRNARLRT
jgi:hypothetical protein